MADPKSIVPYSDPYESPEDILNFMDFRNPTLADLRINERFGSESPAPQPNDTIGEDVIGDPIDPSDDPVLWGFRPDYPNPNNCQASGSNFPGGGGGTSNIEGEGTGMAGENSVPVPVWPPEPVPFLCTCCQVLREIFHTNGNEFSKLEIHGRPGIFFHAIYSPNNSASAAGHHCQMFDFCKKSIDGVEQFLKKYCLERKQAGFRMIPDPLSKFLKALCVGIRWDTGTHNVASDQAQPSNPNAESEDVSAETFSKDQLVIYGENEQDGGMSSSMKTSLAAQRERTGKLTIKDVGDYFHLPIEEAAKRMKLCPTVVKKICRRDGLARWPHRKIKAIERQISNWTVTSETSNDPNEVTRAHIEIQRLQQELAKIRETGII